MDVCQHSGQPQATCDYRCPLCDNDYIPSPDLAEIRKRCEAIRDEWTQNQLERQEGHADAYEIPTVIKPNSGLVDRREYRD
jgi:hypothetical protein